MDTSKIIIGTVGGGRYTVTAPIVKEDYGLYLKIEGLELPSTYEVDFSNSEHNGTSVTMIGNADGVLIPSQFISSGKDVFAFLYHVGEDFGRTVYKFRIPNKVRPDRTDDTPTPEEQSTIDQCISALNEAVAQTAQDVIDADQSAQSASDDADRAERAKTSSETAQGKAEEAQESAERAKDNAETSERNASESERKAKGYADTASEKADAITGLTAQATTLPDGSSATASYDAETGVMSFGIPKGKDGTDGDDGYSPTASVTKSGKVATITIADKNGTTSAQVEDGTDGIDGIDGISPSVSVTDITGGHRVVITDESGSKTFDVMDGATGATPNLTIGTVETLEPTESATATITGTPENPVLNLGIPQGDTGEVTLEEFYKAFPTDTASGSIASFSDGADDIPLKSLVVNIDPVQDLHGQDAPYPAGGGKNLFQTTAQSKTENGVTWTVNADGTIEVSGMATGYTDLVAGYARVSSNMGMVTISGISTATNISWGSLTVRDVNDNVLYTITNGGTTAVWSCDLSQYPDAYNILVFVKRNNNNIATSGTVKIQVEKGSTATDWSPYENICPISGWTGMTVNATGVNIWDEEWEVGGYSVNNGGKTVQSSKIRCKNYIPITPNTTYYLYVPTATTTNGYWAACFYDKDKTFVSTLNSGAETKSNGQTFTTPSNCHFMTFFLSDAYGTTYKNDICINYPSTDHDYHPYTGRSITIDLGQTVYGGKLDVLSGELVIDRAMVDLGTLNWVSEDSAVSGLARASARNMGIIYYSTPVCSKFKGVMPKSYSNIGESEICFSNSEVYSMIRVKWSELSGKTDAEIIAALTGVQFCYPLAEPIEIQLTPVQVNSLLGVNNIWANTGDCSVEYRADTKLYIERLTAPDSADMVADANIVSGQYFMVGNNLYKATANIASGSAVIVGTNATRKSLSEALNEINA